VTPVTEIARRYLRQKTRSPWTVGALGVMAFAAAIQSAGSSGESNLDIGYIAVLVLAAGCVSRDVSSGSLQMILCRPVRRSDYLFGRYAGILAAYGALLVVSGGLALALSRAFLPLAGITPRPIGLDLLATAMAGAFLAGAGMAATILFLATFLPGYGDVLGFVLLVPLFSLPDLASRILKAPWLATAGEVLRKNLIPTVDWTAVLRGDQPVGEACGRWVFAAVAYLVLAVVVFSRREFTYGHD
jgi:hypothetical protein